MNLKKVTAILSFAVIPVLAGLLLVAEADQDHSGTLMPKAPGIILPGDHGSGALSILPTDDSKLRIEYRRILFGRHKDKDKSMDQNKTADKDKAADMDKGPSDTWTQRTEEMSPPAAPTPSGRSTQPKDLDKNFNSSDQGSSVDRDTGSSGTFHYIWWWSSKSKDQDKNKSAVNDRDAGSDRDAAKRNVPDTGSLDQGSQQSYDKSNGTDKNSSGMQYILDDSSSSDNDKSEDTEESADTAQQSIIILAASGIGGSSTGGGVGGSAGSSMGMGTGTVEPGTSSGTNDYLGARNPGSSNLDPSSRDQSGSNGPSDFDRDTSGWGSPGGTMDHNSLDNY